MTSSTRARIDGGIVRPSSFAVLRLTTNSNLIGCSTGRSVGGIGASEDLVDVDRGTPLHLGNIYSIGHEPTWLNKHPELIDRGDAMRGR